MRNPGLDRAQAGIKTAGRNINNFRYADHTTIMAESEELRSLLVGLKLNVQKTKIMASGPIISWQINGETMETVRDFSLGGSKITMLAPWKKCYDQYRQHIEKQRHYFANKGPSSQSYGFSSSHVWI